MLTTKDVRPGSWWQDYLAAIADKLNAGNRAREDQRIVALVAYAAELAGYDYMEDQIIEIRGL